ncbi:MAG: hypothetical protein HRT35_17305 [Algicola sp.]|nr:hypothetical protein [Algicola sp.]
MISLILCLLSFMLGWQLSTWSKREPLKATAAPVEDAYKVAPQVETPVMTQPEEAIDGAENENEKGNESGSALWFCDLSYLDEDSAQAQALQVDASAQALEFFVALFNDDEQSLGQRLEAIKAATSMDEKALDQQVINKLHQLLNQMDEIIHHEEIVVILHLLEGKVASDKLDDVASYMAADNPQIREEALKTITRADSKKRYKTHVESILNNDPKSEVRALAFLLLDQHYSSQVCA